MNKREYLNRLEGCLQCVEKSEREAALRYYEEYFDDAGIENEDEVIANLGSPEALAREIITQSAQPPQQDAPAADPSTIGMSFHSIKADVVNANITVILGDKWRVDLSYPEQTEKPEIKLENGVLRIVEERRRGNFTRWFDFSGNNWKQGRIDITVPDVQFNSFSIETVNGNISIPAVRINKLKCQTVNGTAKVDGAIAEEIYCENVNGSSSVISCTVSHECHCETVNGSASMTGEMRGDLHLESVNGSVTLRTTLPLSEYNAHLETVSGTVRVNGEKQRKETTIRSNVARYSLHAETVNGSINTEFGR